MKISKIALYTIHLTGIVIALFTLYSTISAAVQWARLSSAANEIGRLLSHGKHTEHQASWYEILFGPYGIFLLFQSACALVYLFLFFRKGDGVWRPMIPLILLILSWFFVWLVMNHFPPIPT